MALNEPATATLEAVATLAPLGRLTEVTDNELARYAELIYERTGIRISPQKKTLLSNRLRRRLKETGVCGFAEYYNRLRRLRPNDPEWDAFLQEITTHETFLFRDEGQWEWFRKVYLPGCAAEARSGNRPRHLRIWSAACSTGDEAFTAACCIADCLPNHAQWQICILGTDIGTGAVEQAKTGLFGERAMRLVPETYKKRYFRKATPANAWQACPLLTQMVAFRQHNLLDRLSEAPFDLVFLKNVLIYFAPESKRRVMDNVRAAIRPGGLLVAGPAEGIGELVKDFVRLRPGSANGRSNEGKCMMGDLQPETKNELLDSLLGDFLDESDQLLTQLNANLLQLDEWVQPLGEDHNQRCDEGLLNEMFRSAHSLKGLSAMLGLMDINQLTHKIENVFDAARHGQLIVTRDVTELMFMGLDQLTAMVSLLKEPGGEPVDCDAVLEAIRRMLQTAGAEKKQTTQADAERTLGSAAGEKVESLTTALAGSGAAQQSAPLEEIKDEDDIPDNYLSMFVDEADASLDALTGGLLALESGGNGCELKSLLGNAHKIKGSAASVGLNRAAKLAHLMEDLFESLAATGSPLSPRTTDILLKCTDGLRQHVADLKGGGRRFDNFEPLAHGLLARKLRFPPQTMGTELTSAR